MPEHAKASANAVHFLAARRDKLSRSPTVLNEPDEKKIFGDRPPTLRDARAVPLESRLAAASGPTPIFRGPTASSEGNGRTGPQKKSSCAVGSPGSPRRRKIKNLPGIR